MSLSLQINPQQLATWLGSTTNHPFKLKLEKRYQHARKEHSCCRYSMSPKPSKDCFKKSKIIDLPPLKRKMGLKDTPSDQEEQADEEEESESDEEEEEEEDEEEGEIQEEKIGTVLKSFLKSNAHGGRPQNFQTQPVVQREHLQSPVQERTKMRIQEKFWVQKIPADNEQLVKYLKGLSFTKEAIEEYVRKTPIDQQFNAYLGEFNMKIDTIPGRWARCCAGYRLRHFPKIWDCRGPHLNKAQRYKETKVSLRLWAFVESNQPMAAAFIHSSVLNYYTECDFSQIYFATEPSSK